MSKQVLQTYLKWKTDPSIYLKDKKVQNESGFIVTSIYGSILPLINVHSASPHSDVSCVVISFYIFPLYSGHLC